MATVRTNLGLCGVDNCPDCWVDMKVCDRCGRGPTDPDDICGEEDCEEARAKRRTVA